jgi:hypothetical protein
VDQADSFENRVGNVTKYLHIDVPYNTRKRTFFSSSYANIYLNTRVNNSPHLPLYNKERQVRLQSFVFLTTNKQHSASYFFIVLDKLELFLCEFVKYALKLNELFFLEVDLSFLQHVCPSSSVAGVSPLLRPFCTGQLGFGQFTVQTKIYRTYYYSS